MFVFRKVYPFTWTVKVPDGVVPAFEFQARFESIPQSKIDELTKADPARLDANVAALVFKGWDDGELFDEAQNPLPVTPETIASVIDQPFLRGAIVRAYFDAMNGLLRAKN
jgi:hypothetical protein